MSTLKQPLRGGVQGELVLETAALRLTLNTADGLRAISLENRLAGKTLRLDGPEFEVDLDAAERRLWIAGWRCQPGDDGAVPSDEEAGYRAGHHLPGADDSNWSVHETPNRSWGSIRSRLVWSRTQLFLPGEYEGQSLTLVLGGFGLYDYRHLRVFVNGCCLGERHTMRFWESPGRFLLAPGSDAYRALRWGQLNHLAMQAGGIVDRTARLDVLDPHGGRSLPAPDVMGSPFEQYLVVGAQELRTPQFTVTDIRHPPDAALVVELRAAGLTARVVYRQDACGTRLRKQLYVTNTGAAAVQVMNIRLGAYATGTGVSPGLRGFPVYADGATYFSLVHPSGWVTGEEGDILLQQHPGRCLEPGAVFASMEGLIGVAGPSQAQAAFVAHVRERSRRVRRGHDRPYAVFDSFGAWPLEGVDARCNQNTEAAAQHSIARIAEAQRETGLHFDLFSLDFWVDFRGNLERFNPERFPDGLASVRRELAKLGTAPGLWIDSSMSGWSIGGNPAVQGCYTYNPEYMPNYTPGQWMAAVFCRATEPIRTLYKTAFLHHLRENGVRLLKFDNLFSTCSNTRHAHLPGLFSTEAIHEAVIESLREYDEACPECLFFLYWGYRSPWWLLHGDVLFDPGLFMEGASPSGAPTLYVRDGVTVGLDQAEWWCADIPPLGKDSLGVWLSDWFWNSSIGTERWQEGFVMDLCRGSLLAQPWSDWNFLTPPERRQMADFVALLRAQPACFARPRFILGNPWHSEPYGYCCTDGARAFVALNNCTWNDVVLPLSLSPAWGLPDGEAWDVYRWYPDPAKLSGPGEGLCLRPFEVVFLEVVSRGTAPSLERVFPDAPQTSLFAEPSRALTVAALEPAGLGALSLLCDADNSASPVPRRTLQVAVVAPAATTHATLAVSLELFRNERRQVCYDFGRYVAGTATLDGQAITVQPVIHARTHPVGWQAWRVPLEPAARERHVVLTVTVATNADAVLRWQAYFVPGPARKSGADR